MRCFRIIQLETLSMILFSAALSTQATPTFELTGTVTDKVLRYGEIIDSAFNARKWKGKTITGTTHIEIERFAFPSSSEQVYYLSSYSDYPADWPLLNSTTKDGNTYSFHGNYDPPTKLDVKAGAAYSLDSFHNGTHLYNGRTYSDLRFTEKFRPEFANWVDAGIAKHLHGNGKKNNYYFNIGSITSAPQSSSWVLILCGLVGLFLARRQHETFTSRKKPTYS